MPLGDLGVRRRGLHGFEPDRGEFLDHLGDRPLGDLGDGDLLLLRDTAAVARGRQDRHRRDPSQHQQGGERDGHPAWPATSVVGSGVAASGVSAMGGGTRGTGTGTGTGCASRSTRAGGTTGQLRQVVCLGGRITG